MWGGFCAVAGHFRDDLHCSRRFSHADIVQPAQCGVDAVAGVDPLLQRRRRLVPGVQAVGVTPQRSGDGLDLLYPGLALA